MGLSVSNEKDDDNFCCWSVLVSLVGQKMVVATQNSFYFDFGPILDSIPNFNPIGRETQKLKIFTIGRAGRSKNDRRCLKLNQCCF